MSEVDAKTGSHSETYLELSQIMQELGYSHQYFEKSTATSASAIFYKQDKFSVIESSQRCFSPEEPEFLMHCLFRLESNPAFKFVFSETHLQAEPAGIEQRIQQTNFIQEYYADQYQDVPVFIAGNFNEEYKNEPITGVMNSGFQDLYSLMQ